MLSGQAIEDLPIVAAEPRKHGQVMAPGENVHRIDLQQMDPLKDAAHLPRRDGASEPFLCKSLRFEGDSTCLRERKGRGHFPIIGGCPPGRLLGRRC